MCAYLWEAWAIDCILRADTSLLILAQVDFQSPNAVFIDGDREDEPGLLARWSGLGTPDKSMTSMAYALTTVHIAVKKIKKILS